MTSAVVARRSCPRRRVATRDVHAKTAVRRAALPAFPITETLASSEQQLIWQAAMMPIHIHPASVAQGKYFPKLSINRKTIFEQLRGETERVKKGRRWRGTEGEILILYVYMQYIFIKWRVLKVKLETHRTGMWSDTIVNVDLCCLDCMKLWDLRFLSRKERWADTVWVYHCCYWTSEVKKHN